MLSGRPTYVESLLLCCCAFYFYRSSNLPNPREAPCQQYMRGWILNLASHPDILPIPSWIFTGGGWKISKFDFDFDPQFPVASESTWFWNDSSRKRLTGRAASSGNAALTVAFSRQIIKQWWSVPWQNCLSVICRPFRGRATAGFRRFEPSHSPWPLSVFSRAVASTPVLEYYSSSNYSSGVFLLEYSKLFVSCCRLHFQLSSSFVFVFFCEIGEG